MPAIISSDEAGPARLPFPPVTKSHILHCSYHDWHPRYRNITPKARLIPLTRPFMKYLRADGIILPDDDVTPTVWSDHDSGNFSSSESASTHKTGELQDDEDDEADEVDSGNENADIAAEWRPLHQQITNTISELGGKVMPKLNWSAPKDATWMNANTMECRDANDIYLLLKSSDFVTHDLEHAFDDCIDTPGSNVTLDDIPYHLVLRKSVSKYNPNMEFRCFVRERKLLGMCQRDMNHFEFLFPMQAKLASLIHEFFGVRLCDTFPDESFVFDVYIPAPYNRVWLIDINPFAPRTDPILFSWMELLSMPDPPSQTESSDEDIDFVRLPIRISSGPEAAGDNQSLTIQQVREMIEAQHLDDDDSDDADEEIWLPELRLIRKDDPEACSFATPQYSAHKLPRDVVDASQSGEGLREFARDWENILAKQRAAENDLPSSDDES